MKFSLINVVEHSGNLVSGYWIEGHVGTLDSARKAARATEAVSRGEIMVAVVPAVPSPCAILRFWSNLAWLE